MWHVSIRRAAPAIVLAGVWVAIMTTTEISVTDFFQVRTFAEEVYTQSALGTLDFSGEQRAGSNEQDATSSQGVLPAPRSPLAALSATGLWSGLALSTALALAAIAVA